MQACDARGERSQAVERPRGAIARALGRVGAGAGAALARRLRYSALRSVNRSGVGSEQVRGARARTRDLKLGYLHEGPEGQYRR